MLSRMGLHRVAYFYGAAFLLAIIIGKAADVGNIITRHPLSVEDVLVRLAAGVLIGVSLALLSIVAGRILPLARRMDELLSDAVGPLSVSDALLLALLSGLAEEALFRGALQPWLGLPVASLLFALAHLPPKRELWVWTVTAGALGLGFGWVTMTTQDILTAAAAHAAVNAIGLWRLGKLAADRERRAGMSLPLD